MPPESDPFASLLGYQLRRLSQLVMADLAIALEPLQLRAAEASTLFAIRMRSGLTQSDLGRILGIKRANMAPLIAGLEERGAISRAAVDGRSQALRLTAAGEKLHDDARAVIDRHEARCFGAVTRADRDRLTGELARLVASMEQFCDRP